MRVAEVIRVAVVVLAACGRIDFDPIGVPPATTVQLAMGRVHACLLQPGGALYCWGANMTGQLGLGQAAYGLDARVPTQVAPQITWTQAGPGWYHGCALDDAGRAWCWGSNSNGQLGVAPATCGNGILDPPAEACDDGNEANGDGCNAVCQSGATAPDVADPTPVTTALRFRTIRSGTAHTCAIATDGTLWCWGRNGATELGLGDTADRSTPHQVKIVAPQVGRDDGWIDQSLGEDHTCALQQDMSLWCWGSNGHGQLGQGASTAIDRSHPEVVQAGSTWRRVGLGQAVTCSIGGDARAYCFGEDDVAQLGVGDLLDRDVPTEVSGGSDVDRIAVGVDHACARHSDGTLVCWGSNNRGQLGRGTTSPYEAPAVLAGPWTDVGAGELFTCALDAAGAAWCWGAGDHGDLGTGSTNSSSVPVQVSF